MTRAAGRVVALLVVTLVTLVALPAPAGAADSRAANANQPHALSLRDAITQALANNVQTLLADARRAEAEGDRKQALAAFLPHLSGAVSQSRRQTNLAAQGLDLSALPSPPGAPAFPSVNTYNNFDARARLRQRLFDYSALQRYRGARIGRKVADERLAVAREQVAAQAALDYVAAAAARQSVAAAGADLDLAKTLQKLALDQLHVGMATGVDVTRAKARHARATARLAQARTDQTRADLRLARTVGLPLAAPIRLTEALRYRPVAFGDADAEVSKALARRPEVELATQRVRQREKLLAAARGARLPTLSATAEYGVSGNTWRHNDEDVYAVGAQINVPIFDGGAISAKIDSAASRLSQQRIRYRDTRAEVEQDVRLARRTLQTLAERVRSARAALDLARRELALSRDRFAHGVGDNIEVIDAQASLADARNTRVAALADYTRARINRAAALGRAQRFSLEHPATR